MCGICHTTFKRRHRSLHRSIARWLVLTYVTNVQFSVTQRAVATTGTHRVRGINAALHSVLTGESCASSLVHARLGDLHSTLIVVHAVVVRGPAYLIGAGGWVGGA